MFNCIDHLCVGIGFSEGSFELFLFFFLLQIIFLLSNGEKITNVEAILLLFKTINSQKPLCTIQKGKKC